MSGPGTASFKGEAHKCVFCSRSFSSKGDLQSHFRQHANGEIDIKGRPKIKSETPQKDEKDSGKQDDVEDASKSFTTEKINNAVCDICGEVFHTVSLAISHKFRKHPESVKKHYCPHCGMMFPIKLNRDKHLLTHPGVAPKQVFPCLTCGVAFYNQRARKFHMDSAHKGAHRMVNPIKTPTPSMKIILNNAGEAQSVYYCHLCGCEYQIKYNLQKHLGTHHTNEEREAVPEEIVQCNLCSALFYSKRAYEAHNHHHRASDLYATTEEMRQQVVQRIDQDFDQRRVPTPFERYLSAYAVSSHRSATWHSIRGRRNQMSLDSSRSYALTSKSKVCDTSPSESSSQTISWSGVPGVDGTLSLDVSSCTDRLYFKNVDGSPIFDEVHREDIDKNADNFLEGSDVCWDLGSHSRLKKRTMLHESEEEDNDVKNLGTVNPDTVIPNRRILRKVSSDVDEVPKFGNTNKHRKEKDREENEEDDSVIIDASEDKEGTSSLCSYGVGSDIGCDLVVEKIVGMRKNPAGREFLVRWQGFEPADDTWEREEFLNCSELVSEFISSKKGKARGQRSIQNPIEWYESPRIRKRKKKSKE